MLQFTAGIYKATLYINKKISNVSGIYLEILVKENEGCSRRTK